MFDRDRFIADCRDAVTKEHAVAAVRDLVAQAVSRPSAVEASLGTPRTGGLFPIYRSSELTVEDNTFYRRGAHGVTAGGKRLEHGETALLGEAIIHAVANPLRICTAAIHVSVGDFFGTPRSEWTADGLVERPFDAERARRVFAEASARWEQTVLGQPQCRSKEAL